MTSFDPSPKGADLHLEVQGRVVEGHRIASGEANDSPYPAGSLSLQIPHFRDRGLDLSDYHRATINVALEVSSVRILQPDHHFAQVRWFEGIPAEDFSFVRCRLEYRGQTHEGWVYYPHPETKPAHRQPSNVIEVVTHRVADLSYGDAVTVEVDPQRVEVVA